MSIASGQEAAARIMEALGMHQRGVERVVVVADAAGTVQIYVSRKLDCDQVEPLCQALREAVVPLVVTEVAGVEVDELGRVYVPAAGHAEALRRMEADFARKGLECPPPAPAEVFGGDTP